MKQIKIYPIEYLSNEILTDEDLDNLFSNKCLTYSLIIGMFDFIQDKRSHQEIIDFITTDNKWMYKTTWTKRQMNMYERKVAKCFKNIYSYSDIEAKHKAQWWIVVYGFNIHKNVVNF